MSVKNLIDQIEKDGDYRVLQKLDLSQTYNDEDDSEKKVAIFLDTETTGTDVEKDQIIELGMVAFEYSPETGKIYKILGELNQLEEPSVKISEEAIKVHGISYEMLKGQKIDDNKVKDFICKARVIIAHNASFDRPITEKRFPFFADKYWGCSMKDVPWKENGYKIRALEFLAYKYGYFFEGHRATIDCLAAIHLLSKALPDSKNLVLRELINNARQNSIRIAAVGAPFSTKDDLKARGYEWNPKAKYWFFDAIETESSSEMQWLSDNLNVEGQIVATFNATKRHSSRI